MNTVGSQDLAFNTGGLSNVTAGATLLIRGNNIGSASGTGAAQFVALTAAPTQLGGTGLAGASAAVDGATVNADLTYDPLNAPGATAYPITAPTYILASVTYSDAAKGAAVKGFIQYVLTDGQALAADTPTVVDVRTAVNEAAVPKFTEAERARVLMQGASA